MRIGIIGGGAAGLATAWLIERDHDVTLYEAQDRLGGHAHTIDVDIDGRRVSVDAGFQFFGPGRAYATFHRLLDALGVPRRTYRATMTLFDQPADRHVALPPFRHGCPVWPSLTPSALCDLIHFRRFLQGVPAFLALHDTTITIEEYIRRQRLPASFVRRFLYPLLLALWCVELADFKGFAAYNALFYIGETLSDGLRAPEQVEIEGGMKTYVDAVARGLDRAELLIGAEATRLEHVDGEFWVTDAAGARRPYDQVVLATGPREALALLEPLRGFDALIAQLARFEYFPTDIAIHGDRRLMPRRRSAWSAVNARWDGAHSQLSIWNPDRGIPVFRSWITFEDRLPEPLYATASYEHLQVTVDHFAAQRELQRLRGRDRVWLAGLYMDDADSHESAVHSAVEIARHLAPGSPRLELLVG